MRLRNGKSTYQNVNNKFLNLLVENIFDIINFINKDKAYQFENIHTHKKRKNIITVENICNIFYICFQYKILEYYDIKTVTFECDYKMYNNLFKTYKTNSKHINNINKICVEFFKSSHYKKMEEKILNDYEEILNFTNKNVKYKIVKIIRLICLISLSYYYFHMVIIESMYNDCLIWSCIRKMFNTFKYNHYDYCDIMPISKIITYSINLYNSLVLDEDDFCKYIRNFTMQI